MTRTERQKLLETKIAEFKASGQSAATWARENNIKPNQLYYWRFNDTLRGYNLAIYRRI